MKAYVIALIVIACFISAIAALLILRCLCNRGRKKKETVQYPTVRPSVTTPPPQQSHRDVEKGERIKSSGTKDGGMVILGGAAGIATAAAVASITSGCGGGAGCGGGGCGGGGCGGGGCGGGCGG